MTNKNAATNGRRKALVDDLYGKVRDAIDASYYTGERNPNGSRETVSHDDERAVLRDYVRNQGWQDKFDNMVKRETVHEKGHRRGAPNGWRFKFSSTQGALIVLLNNIGDGAKLDAMPAATGFLTMRDTAAEANLLGWLARAELAKVPGLLDALALLDYAEAGRDAGE